VRAPRGLAASAQVPAGVASAGGARPSPTPAVAEGQRRPETSPAAGARTRTPPRPAPRPASAGADRPRTDRRTSGQTALWTAPGKSAHFSSRFPLLSAINGRGESCILKNFVCFFTWGAIRSQSARGGAGSRNVPGTAQSLSAASGCTAMGEWTILERLLEAAVQQHSTMIGR
jgi:hypothetical protein